jgi:ABC-2 type transport system permease protein
VRTVLLVLYNETWKRLLIIWDYKFDILTQLLTVSLIFIGATFFLGDGRFDDRQLPMMLLGYVVWFYARIVLIHTSADLVNEAAAGTLEQMYMSPISAEVLLLGRLFAMLVVTTLLVFFPTLGLILLLHIHIPPNWEGIVILILTLAGLFGFTMILTGAALVFKQIGALADLTQNILLFLSGSLVPVTHFPAWLAIVARTLPITQGIIVLREVVLDGQSLVAVWTNGSLIWLMVHSALYCAGGWLVFKLCERIAKQQGSLGQY